VKRIELIREIVSDTEIQGRLNVGPDTLYTIERPWVPESPGGKPFESCVPAGTYRLSLHTRGNGDIVPAMTNHGLAVYYAAADRPGDVGRYKCLLHSANWVHQIHGCIAPGKGRAPSNQGPMVTSSRAAMKVIMDYLGDSEAELEIVGENKYE
jgi:hypothetical protein